MTEPKEPASDETAPTVSPPIGEQANVASGEESAPVDETANAEAAAAAAEAEAAALAADELGSEDEPEAAPIEAEDGGAADDDEEFPETNAHADAAEEVGAGAAAVGSGAVADQRATRGPRAARTVTPATIIDPSIKVTDRASAIFVIGTVLVFVLIFAYGALLGVGGTFTPFVEPSPEPTPSVQPSESPAASASPAASSSPGASGSPGASVAPSGSVAPSASPAASGSPAPS